MNSFQMPVTPTGLSMPLGVQTSLLWLMGIAAAVSFAYMLAQAVKRRDPLPIYILLGAALAIVYEPLGDSLVLAFYADVGQVTWIEAFGRKTPAFIGLLYFWYFPPFVLYFAAIAARGISRRQWWTLWLLTLVFATVFEQFWMQWDPWVYYGPQALVLFKLPLSAPFTYASFIFAVAAGVHGIQRFVPARHHWLIVPAVPMLLAGSHAATALPAAAALYSSDNSLVILAGALGSMLFAVLLSWTLSLLLTKPVTSSAT